GRNPVIHIGTSATMVAHKNATPEERQQAVADFATRFFGHEIGTEHVIEETLEPITEGGVPDHDALRQALDMPVPDEREALRRHPLARWLEFVMGVEKEADGRLCRRSPRTLSDATKELAMLTGRDEGICREKLQEVLLAGLEARGEKETPLFPFKLHQFISQGRSLLATMEHLDKRHFSFEAKGLEETLVWAPLRFCRVCGQDHYQVVQSENSFLPYEDRMEGEEEVGIAGYLTPDFPDMLELEDLLPPHWFDRNGRLSPTWRQRVPRKVWVHADGSFSEMEVEGATPMWWQEEKFWLCLRCGENYTARESEYTKLAGLSTEGRASATTAIAIAFLRHARKGETLRPKLLSFTDNRQDASLQAGHFNDFVQVGVLRSGLYSALEKHERLEFDTVARECVQHMGLRLSDIAQNRMLDPDSVEARQVWNTFEQLVEYRLYEDLRRGWRLVQPNLEDVGLLRIEYQGLPECIEDGALAERIPDFARLDPPARERILRAILDFFRKQLAIHVRILQETEQQQLRRRSEQRLNEFWGLDPDNPSMRTASVVMLPGDANQTPRNRIFRITPRTLIGRFLTRELGLQQDEISEVIRDILEYLVGKGLLRELDQFKDHRLFQLDAQCLVWCKGDGNPPKPDPLWSRRTTEYIAGANRFFQNFYRDMAKEIAHLEAREHTAQVVASGERERRERRFRGEEEPPLPYLVCSPTMELGIDIADLDVVHMRNVPPTPANYAQRSGRAGRQGQAGLILTYCGAFSSHDQYFFHHREEMVAGSVRAPRLDLTNESLIRAHTHAEWLAQVGLPLRDSAASVINTDLLDSLPLRDEVAPQLKLGESALGELRERLFKMIEPDRSLLMDSGWFDESGQWLEHTIEQAPESFDKAFNLWRDLYRAACGQMQRAQELLLRSSREEQDKGRRLQEEALHQRNLLLQQNVAREEGDFYP
ncbi:DEAD/DEAH box helicase, partial [Candidatus Parcubacteria bacterium]